MPEWKIHNKWARKLGIARDVSNFVNKLIDFPEKCDEYQAYCEEAPDARIYSGGKPTKMTIASFTDHDSARSSDGVRKVQIDFMRSKGNDYLKAGYLHHVLDYLKWWATQWELELPTMEYILRKRKLEEKIGPINDIHLQKVKNFVINNSKEILNDLLAS